MTTYSNIAGAEPSTVTFRVATVVIPRGSTNEQQEILVIGDPQSSLGQAAVTATAPPSTTFGLAVRLAGGPSSAADCVIQIQGNSTVMQGTSPWVVGPAKASTSARSSVTQSSTSVTMQNANGSRLQWTCQNNPTQNSNLYLKFGATASTADWDVRMAPFAYYEMPQPIYTGRIDGIWDSTGVGYARVCEWLT